MVVNIKPDESPLWLTVVTGFLPWLLIIFFFFYASRAMQNRMTGGGSGGIFNFSRSRARRYERSDNGPTFDDVAGLESAKQDLQEVVDYLKSPTKFQRLGAKMPKGILMMGAPGTGKTLLAKAPAAEAEVPFFSISGSEFIELYVGVGASRVRDMFANARKEAPSLIFIDEIDSVGRVRGTGLGGGNDEREQTLNQILAEMDGFEPEEVVVVLAATNRPDVLDPALLRPGRFDRKVILELPQKKARREILRVHTRKTPLADDVDLEKIAAMTVGFSGADIENLVNEAALHAARTDASALTDLDFLYARDKVVMGTERKDLINVSERARIACHESGHALTALLLPHSDPVQKVSIVPRGRALGVTEQLPTEDRHNIDELYLKERLQILLGGRGAEKLMYGNISSGAANDLKEATSLARSMVVNWGMSEEMGPLCFRDGEAHPFLGRELAEPRSYSEATAQLIDQEIRRLLQEAEAAVLQLLGTHRDSLQRLVDDLLEHESLDHQQILALLDEDKPRHIKES
ncbi:Cell division protein FtsH [gamma proteobacterium IMCC2047]|nr:Cell division protein FtsH [gamma proteobacterium IMCC2047]